LDNLTHSLFAITLGRTPLGRAGRGTTAALLIASNIPDIDIVTLAGGGASYLKWHRGPTHGPIGIIVLGLVSAGLAWLWQRFRDHRNGVRPLLQDEPRASFGMLAVIAIIGVLLHVLMDVPTSYGTRVLSPFDWHWFAADWLPIIDVYLLMALAIGLLFGAVSPAARRRNAAIVLMLMAANYGVRGIAHHEALVVAPRLFGPLLPAKCDPADTSAGVLDHWPRADLTNSPAPGRRCLVEIAAIPTFVSPFKWRVIAHLSNAYEIHELDLLDERFRGASPAADSLWRVTLRFPNNWMPRVTQAATTDLGRVFLGFSRFPSARAFTDPSGATTVRWSDMRFAGGILTLDQPVRRLDPFTATVHIGADGQVDAERLGR
jgi:inner membrane protein